MRLPWPFGRRTPSDGPSEAAPEGPASAASVSPAPSGSGSGPGPGAPTGAWAQLPPIQRTTGAPPVVAPAAAFLDAVPGHHPLPPIVTPLGHDTGPAAPAGLVLARPAVVPSLTSSAPMPGRPVQRRASAAAATEPAWDLAAAWSEPAGETPVRSLPSVSPAATVTPSSRPLTTAPAHAASAVQRSTSAAAAGPSASGVRAAGPGTGPGSAGPGTAASMSAPGSSGAAPLPAPRGTPPARTVSRWAESPSAATPPAGLGAPLAALPGSASAEASSAGSAPAATSAGAAPQSTGSSAAPRRAGLGMPMSAPPAGTVAQRMPMATPPGRRAMPDVPSRAAAGLPGAPATAGGGEAGPVAAPAAPTAPRSLPVLSVARQAAGHSPATDHSHDHGGRAGTLPMARGGSRAGSPTASTVPTLGARPLRPSVTAQREPSADAGSGAGSTSTSGSGAGTGASPVAPTPVTARWTSGGELPATVEALPPARSTGDPVPLQRLAAGASAGATGSGAGPGTRTGAGAATANVPREIVFPPRDGLAAAAAGTAAGSRATVQRAAEPALPGFAAAPASSASRPPAMTLHHAPAPSISAAPQAAPAPAPSLQRIVADPVPATAPVVGASRPGGAAALPGITATPVVQRIDGAAPDPGGAPGGHSDTELDELARALFGRIRTHLRSEVIHEREAKGLSFDAF